VGREEKVRGDERLRRGEAPAKEWNDMLSAVEGKVNRRSVRGGLGFQAKGSQIGN